MPEQPDLPIGALVWAPVPVMVTDHRIADGVAKHGSGSKTHRALKVAYVRACLGRIEQLDAQGVYTVRVACDQIVFCREHELILVLRFVATPPAHLTEAQMIPRPDDE